MKRRSDTRVTLFLSVLFLSIMYNLCAFLKNLCPFSFCSYLLVPSSSSIINIVHNMFSHSSRQAASAIAIPINYQSYDSSGR